MYWWTKGLVLYRYTYNDKQKVLLMRMDLWDFTVGTFVDLWICCVEDKNPNWANYIISILKRGSCLIRIESIVYQNDDNHPVSYMLKHVKSCVSTK